MLGWPSAVRKQRPRRLTVRTGLFQGPNTGPTPVGVMRPGNPPARVVFLLVAMTPSSVWETLRRGIEDLASIVQE